MRLLNDIIETSTVALSSNSEAVDVSHMSVASLVASITAANPSNDTFVDGNVSVANNTVTLTAHDFLTGAKVTLTTTGVLPGGLAGSTDYYLISVDADTFSFATNQANALAGTAIDITSAAGGGTHTVTVTTTIAGSVKLQKSIIPTDNPNLTAVWVDVTSSSTDFTGTDTLTWELSNIGYTQLRTVTTVTSGTVTASIRINAKGF